VLEPNSGRTTYATNLRLGQNVEVIIVPPSKTIPIALHDFDYCYR